MTEEQEMQLSPVAQAETVPIKQTFIERQGISPVLFAFISLVVIFMLYQIVGGVITFLVLGMKPDAENVFGFRVATGIGQLLFILIPTFVLVRFVSFSAKEYLRVRVPDVRTLILPVVGIFSLQQMLQVYLTFQEKIPIPEPFKSEIQKFKDVIEEAYKLLINSNTIPELLFVIVVVALIPAIAEEFLFRGLIQRSFEKGLTPVKGVIITGIIFGAYHLNPFGFVPLAMIGMYLGFLAMRANSLWVSIAAHFYNNAFACIATYLHLDDDFMVTGDPGHLSVAGLLASFFVFTLVFALSTYYFVKVTRRGSLQSTVQPQLS
jgi:membrane protease YdiL (CAAX protease family)